MGPTPSEERLAVFRVRKTVWFVFISVLFLSLAAPTVTVIQQRRTTLQASVSVWPARPRAGEIARLVVTLDTGDDQAAVRGPWAQLLTTWDMPRMQMGAHQAAIQGTQDNGGIFTIPLQLDMAGSWQVQTTLQTPGRPTWHDTRDITVLPSAKNLPGATSGGRMGGARR